MCETGSHLAGTTTLVLRPADRAASLIDAIHAAGGQAICAPLITRAALNDDERDVLDRAIAEVHTYAWVAITSVNAVSEIISSCARMFPDVPLADVAARTKWATVGPATTRALEAHGIIVDFEASENSAAGMLAAWPQHPASGTVLLPLGNLASTQLEDGLLERGFHTTRVTAYTTISHPAPLTALQAWNAGDVDAVIMTSGSGVREFVHQFDPLSTGREDPRPLIITIGEPTARVANAMGLSVDVIAKTATNRGLFDALNRGFSLVEEN
ncbi:uroporphyrinogen-III synthase [Timonella sp. A28]|uniref:uroporphyrinogen-III synthase n=1 Tax=Timonella sp. A28 TaxID=3442640 RepID=UPI003EB9E074